MEINAPAARTVGELTEGEYRAYLRDQAVADRIEAEDAAEDAARVAAAKAERDAAAERRAKADAEDAARAQAVEADPLLVILDALLTTCTALAARHGDRSDSLMKARQTFAAIIEGRK